MRANHEILFLLLLKLSTVHEIQRKEKLYHSLAMERTSKRKTIVESCFFFSLSLREIVNEENSSCTYFLVLTLLCVHNFAMGKVSCIDGITEFII